MKLRFENITENPGSLLRRAGYTFIRTEEAEMSFILPMSRSGYPRFHIFAKTEGTTLHVNLHLDQKRETYGHVARHHGEYENSDVLSKEAERLKQFIH